MSSRITVRCPECRAKVTIVPPQVRQPESGIDTSILDNSIAKIKDLIGVQQVSRHISTEYIESLIKDENSGKTRDSLIKYFTQILNELTE